MSKNSADPLRVRLRNLRETIPVAERQQGNDILCREILSWFDARRAARHSEYTGTNPLVRPTKPEIVAGFWPVNGEPDLRPVYTHLHNQGWTVVLPAVVKKHAPLAFYGWQPSDPLQAGAFGVLEPMRGATLQPTILLVPTLGFTAQGARIGYGGGYYDRTLAQIKQTGQPFITIGIAWDQARLDETAGHQPEDHDYPLDTILTPSGWTPAPPPV
jgi:5-formyltetrahydrofolate cyclo-ligase